MHLINADNQHLYRPELEDMYRARKQIFVDGFGWDLKLTNGMDIDQFDDARAEYVVGFDSAHNSVMSLRLRPTDDISLLGDLFGHVLPTDMRPLDDGLTWEATRGFCLEYGRKPWNMQRKGACMTAPFEIMRARGLDRLVAFTDTRMFTFVVNMGWQFRILGDAVPYGEGSGFALEVDVNDQLIKSMRDMWGLPGPGYVHVESLEPGETVHIAAMRLARAQGIDFLAARDDLSRLRRDRSKPAEASAAAA